MSIVVTGGAGFIGSCVVRTLNDIGREDILVVDNIRSTEKWTNLRNKRYINYINKEEFLDELKKIKGIEAIIHMGACSSTVERDFDYLWRNNVEYSKKLWTYACENDAQFIYASSAATYGNGEQGFSDRINNYSLRPMNGYGYTKLAFDKWMEQQEERPRQQVGLRFFNVYGPNEYNKGSMASMVFHGYKQIKKNGKVRLFKSYRDGISDGMQLRDFVYVKDICDVIIWCLNNTNVNGIYNVGTGCAESFNDLILALFKSLDMEPNIEYIDMPENLIDKYQYYTKADMEKLHLQGYNRKFFEVKYGENSGVRDYVINYLDRGFEVY